MKRYVLLLLCLMIPGLADAAQKYNPYTGQWEEDTNTQTVNLNVNRPLTWDEKQRMESAQLGQAAGQVTQTLFGPPIQERELYSKTFGEPLNLQNKQRPLTALEMQRLQHYFQTKRDLWQKDPGQQ